MRPHRHAMPAMPAQLPVRLPAMPPVPVPTAAPMAAMARLAVASAVAADAGLVLTRTIAHRRDVTRSGLGGSIPSAGRGNARNTAKEAPFRPNQGGEGADGGEGPPPGGGFSP